ncbi:hypothetical protein ACEUZ9_004115 [Paracoccus litorisediminis]|uniref:hypothetical protein n=1 Tax=Paracoccus litorisediminis TaxID=2006130 RepID=UPI00372EDC10
MTKLRPVTLVIVDASPLFTLAVIDRLDLLQAFGRPIYVTDVVQKECLRYPDRPRTDRLRDWFSESGSNQRHVIETAIGPAYDRALEMERDGISNATADLGEWSMTWVMNNLSALVRRLNLTPDEHIGLILVDDNDYATSGGRHGQLPKNTHFLSTRAFFIALAELDVISSETDLREAIKAAGRTRVSKAIFDIPHKEGGIPSNYISGMKATVSDPFDLPKTAPTPGKDPEA